jgi:atypical dual specificity phosphatase
MPHNFTFVIEGVLAGMERPGTFQSLREDLEFLFAHNVRAIASLTEATLERSLLDEFGFRYLHLPVQDFAPPTEEQIDQFVKFQREAEAAGVATVVHCGAGLGRTGTMLACTLVGRGLTAEAAIERVRSLRPYSIETVEQEECVRRYAELLRQRAPGGTIKDFDTQENKNRPKKPDAN